jgi:phosphomevalonate kinase
MIGIITATFPEASPPPVAVPARFDYIHTSMHEQWQWSVPANLLLAGEYAITDEGGRGIALAIEPRATATLEGSTTSAGGEPSLHVFARLNGAETEITREESAILRAVLETASRSVAGNWRLVIDTRSFFDPDSGRKLGLGSSAAATALLTAALLAIEGVDPVHHRDEVIRRATTAHRAAHDGRGSGYDIATSVLGGAVLFTGGEEPRWERSRSPFLTGSRSLALYGWSQGSPVRSERAVERFDRYIARGSAERTTFLRENNTLIAQLEAAGEWPQFFSAVSASRALGERLGETLGVPATIDVCTPHVDDGWVAKASGAGDERALVLSQGSPRRRVPRQAERIVMSDTGLRAEGETEGNRA